MATELEKTATRFVRALQDADVDDLLQIKLGGDGDNGEDLKEVILKMLEDMTVEINFP